LPEMRQHIRTTRPRLRVYKGWHWRVIVIDERGYVDWDDYKHPEQAIEGARLSVERLLRSKITAEA